MAAAVSTAPGLLFPSTAGARRRSHRISIRPEEAKSHQIQNSIDRMSVQISMGQGPTNDSSDDEDLAPIKLSAEAQAILGEDNPNIESDKENRRSRFHGKGSGRSSSGADIHALQSISQHSPANADGSPAPRVVRIAGQRPSPPKMLARDGSFMYKIHEKSATSGAARENSRTPASQMRRIRVSGSRSQTKSPQSTSSNDRSYGTAKGSTETAQSPRETENAGDVEVDPAPLHPSTILRSRRGEDSGIHSTTRVKRLGTGTLLNGPVRRGMIRRQSEEEHEQLDNHQMSREETPEVEQGRRAREPDLEDHPLDTPISYGSPRYQPNGIHQSHLAIRDELQHTDDNDRIEHSSKRKSAYPMSAKGSNPRPLSTDVQPSSTISSSGRRPIFKIPSLPPFESAHDQENEPPPTFKPTKPSASLMQIHEDHRVASPEVKSQTGFKAQPALVEESPSRQPLAPRSNNTPHRPAPVPPPKMSLIEAATSAGASARSKKSVHCVLNGRTYRRLDCIGRGGSSRVFRIMAENYKIFALKRVNLDEGDVAAVAGYKGEIDLLKKLENVDRVVRLFDYEVNEDKGILSVMMELGESDFNKMLNEQVKADNAKLDVTFTRHYWKEMLECVQAVHKEDVVHSDLKPANFLLVKGQLKLIDFGIAGAIQDNTVNVHRENQIGTPNYMSPESLVCHTPAAGQQAPGTKLLKIGKPSDVWSLGCILYQMTYGQPPFAHITKQFERIMSIPNPKVEIQFPGIGIGGSVVPFGLIKTLRRCLQRDQTLRPTVDELLSDSDPFLNPVAISTEMLGRVIGNVVGYCRKREEKLKEEGKMRLEEGVSVLPKDEEMRAWPGAFYEKLKEAAREGTAW